MKKVTKKRKRNPENKKLDKFWNEVDKELKDCEKYRKLRKEMNLPNNFEIIEDTLKGIKSDLKNKSYDDVSAIISDFYILMERLFNTID